MRLIQSVCKGSQPFFFYLFINFQLGILFREKSSSYLQINQYESEV